MPPVRQRKPAIDRLSAEELSLLWLEDLGWPQDIGLIAVVDRGGLVSADGTPALGALQRFISSRLIAVPRFRQRLVDPGRRRGRPYWADADDFEIADHVHAWRLPAGASESEFLDACEEIRRRGFEPGRPSWQWWMLHGHRPDRVGMLVVAHHTMFDGRTGLAALGSLLPDHPVAQSPVETAWTPRPAPSPDQLMREARRRRRVAAAAILERLRRPDELWLQATQVLRNLRTVARQERISSTSLTRRISGTRRCALVRADLPRVRGVARDHGGYGPRRRAYGPCRR